jgi:hypothetical protein
MSMLSKNQDYMRMVNAVKNSVSKAARQTIQAQSEVRNKVKELKLNGASNEAIAKFEQDARAAILLDFRLANKSRREELQNKLNIIKASWDREYSRNYSENSRIVDDAKRRYSAMGKDELLEEITRINNGNYPTDVPPAVFEELCIAAKQNDLGTDVEFINLRATLKDDNLLEPYKRDPLSKELINEMELLSNPDNFIIKDEDGDLVAMDFDDIQDYVNDPVGEDE